MNVRKQKGDVTKDYEHIHRVKRSNRFALKYKCFIFRHHNIKHYKLPETTTWKSHLHWGFYSDIFWFGFIKNTRNLLWNWDIPVACRLGIQLMYHSCVIINITFCLSLVMFWIFKTWPCDAITTPFDNMFSFKVSFDYYGWFQQEK